MISNLEIKEPNKTEEVIKTAFKEVAGPKGASQQDVLALAYYYIVESATITSESALVQAKRIKANAEAQQQLDNYSAEMQWDSIPQAITKDKHFTVKSTSQWFNCGPNGNNNPTKWAEDHGYNHWKRISVTGGNGWAKSHVKFWNTKSEIYTLNASKIQAAETKNEQVAAERQYLTQKMGVLQQMASVGETHINTISDEASQSMQESSQILKILQSLTFQALLRPKPQS